MPKTQDKLIYTVYYLSRINRKTKKKKTMRKQSSFVWNFYSLRSFKGARKKSQTIGNWVLFTYVEQDKWEQRIAAFPHAIFFILNNHVERCHEQHFLSQTAFKSRENKSKKEFWNTYKNITQGNVWIRRHHGRPYVISAMRWFVTAWSCSVVAIFYCAIRLQYCPMLNYAHFRR